MKSQSKRRLVHKPLVREEAIILGCVIHICRIAEHKKLMDNEGYSYVSHAEVARKTRLNIRLVNSHMHNLWEMGILEVKMYQASRRRFYKVRLDSFKARHPPLCRKRRL